ncbi:MAG TPA: UDP-N-acetylglucosamine--N-acetylmuramyl-(pentapeptide) pyrophosphoryl-undecaprenol N-acetylglucosamine transferase [Acidimicrobiia bacterium]|nr:UDP-N-acetylglucosamine--N-acetylmuramyl-(pentapeptide) pyrophosphoryl-undecaprenol N-acetylglucosamine transferase [Acidimicrobiia bacterium]
MSFAIAAAGTGGHVFPGLAVGEALVAGGVERGDVLFVGGSRLEAEVYPQAGFPFLGVEIRGLQRRMTKANFGIARVVARATGKIAETYRERNTQVVLGMGGYVTIPAGWAAARAGGALFLHEQNAEAGLANRLMARRSRAVFTSFPSTAHIPGGNWTGNPIRTALAAFDRAALRTEALRRYELDPKIPVVGMFGGSLGAGVINRTIEEMMRANRSLDFQVVHIAGSTAAPALLEAAAGHPRWRVIGFEEEMQWFYAASDLVVARAGGAVAELTATATPSILIPGGFGSGGHQAANAGALAEAGAALVVEEDHMEAMADLIAGLVEDRTRLAQMADATRTLARPDAAAEIARHLLSAHD